jgi:hypothetical protein
MPEAVEREELKYTRLIFHALPRAEVRDMLGNGVSEKVAMAISGHGTRSVFDHYDIVSESDLRPAQTRWNPQ